MRGLRIREIKGETLGDLEREANALLAELAPSNPEVRGASINNSLHEQAVIPAENPAMSLVLVIEVDEGAQ